MMAQFNQVVQCIPTVGKKYLVCGFTCLCVLLNLYICKLTKNRSSRKDYSTTSILRVRDRRFNQGVQRMSDLELELVVTDSTNI